MKDKLKQLKADRTPALKAIQKAYISQGFLARTPSKMILSRSLACVDRRDLEGRTLLSPDVHKAHAERLTNRYLKRLTQIKMSKGKQYKTQADLVSNHFRFVTIIDSVNAVDAKQAIKSVVKLKKAIATTVSNSKGIWCLGAIEAEVVAIDKMARLVSCSDVSGESEFRKLDVCQTLAEDLKGSLYQSDSTCFLIHFHGVITAKSPDQFLIFRERLLANKQWAKAPRQIEIKKLSEEFAGRSKTTEASLKHIASYITKGGNDWNAGKQYFNYKFTFDGDSEEEWVRKSLYRDQALRAEHALDGIEDPLLMTVTEVSQLAILIDLMMGLNRTRDGYLVSAGSR